MDHLATPEHDRDLDLGPVVQKTHHVPFLGLVVVAVDLGPHLHLFDHDLRLLLSRLSLSDRLLVLELSVVHDPADGRVGLGRHLDEVEVLLLGQLERFPCIDDPDLSAVCCDDPYLGDPDALVDSQLLLCDALLLSPTVTRREKPVTPSTDVTGLHRSGVVAPTPGFRPHDSGPAVAGTFRREVRDEMRPRLATLSNDYKPPPERSF